jgi:gluconokinase
MAAGHPLDDTDRYPWLKLVRVKAEDLGSTTEQGVVIACSALKRSYRDILRGKKDAEHSPLQTSPSPSDALPTFFVFLKGEKEVLRQRMEVRSGHFMKSSMLDSQLAALESPEGEAGVAVVNIEDQTEEQVRIACEGLCTFLHQI